MAQWYSARLEMEESHVQVSPEALCCVLKEVKILAIILVPRIMTLSRGHTGQIKRTVIMR